MQAHVAQRRQFQQGSMHPVPTAPTESAAVQPAVSPQVKLISATNPGHTLSTGSGMHGCNHVPPAEPQLVGCTHPSLSGGPSNNPDDTENNEQAKLDDLTSDILLHILCHAATSHKPILPWLVCKQWRQLLLPKPAMAQFLAAAHGPDPALMVAAGHGQQTVCRHLMSKAGARPEASKGAPLHAAVIKGRLTVVKLLLQHGTWEEADPTLSWALCIAASDGSVPMCEALLATGGTQLVTLRGSEALHWAAAHGHADVCGVLLQAGAQATSRDSWALHVAAQRGGAGSLEVCRVLLAAGARAASRNSRALQWGVKTGNWELCELLVLHGAVRQLVDSAVLLEGVKRGGDHARAARVVLGGSRCDTDAREAGAEAGAGGAPIVGEIGGREEQEGISVIGEGASSGVIVFQGHHVI